MAKDNFLKRIDKEIEELHKQVNEEMSLPCICGHEREDHIENPPHLCWGCYKSPKSKHWRDSKHVFKLDNFAFIKQIYGKRKHKS